MKFASRIAVDLQRAASLGNLRHVIWNPDVTRPSIQTRRVMLLHYMGEEFAGGLQDFMAGPRLAHPSAVAKLDHADSRGM